jgi:hypothetical protein
VNARRFYYQKQKKNKKKDHDKDVFKIGVEHIEGNVGLYLYLYSLGT